jgi:hypothetical protein
MRYACCCKRSPMWNEPYYTNGPSGPSAVPTRYGLPGS